MLDLKGESSPYELSEKAALELIKKKYVHGGHKIKQHLFFDFDVVLKALGQNNFYLTGFFCKIMHKILLLCCETYHEIVQRKINCFNFYLIILMSIIILKFCVI